MIEKKINIDNFISECKDAVGMQKDSAVKTHVVRKYVPYEEKISICERVIRATTYEKFNNDESIFKINSPGRKMLYAINLIDSYTDITIDFRDGGALYAYNRLKEAELFEVLISKIPAADKEEFDEILELTLNDMRENEHSVYGMIENKLTALEFFLTNGFEALLNNLISGYQESSEESLPTEDMEN